MVRSQGFELRDKVTTIFPGTAVSMMKKVRTKVRKKLRRFYTVKKKKKRKRIVFIYPLTVRVYFRGNNFFFDQNTRSSFK